jgi:C-methyltransferase
MAGKGQIPDPDRSAFDHVSRLIVGGRIAQIISVVAELGIPDLLQDSPRTGEEIAQATGAHVGAIQRLMRAVAALGLVSVEDDRYVSTSLGATLRSDLPERLDLHARYLGQEASWDAWGDLMYSIRTGEAAFSHALGVQPWEYGEQHPWPEQRTAHHSVVRPVV